MKIMPNGNEDDHPNIFDYATKELSQDAMICWLIDWAGQNEDTCNDEEQQALRNCGRQFVQALLNHKRADRVQFNGDIKTKIYQQDKGIDVLARITESATGKQYILLIEDKTGTGDHSDQLRRYYKAVVDKKTKLGKVSMDSIFPIYLKTYNQSLKNDKRIEGTTVEGQKNGYKVFHRKDFLDVLQPYSGSHPILCDFRAYLQDIEDRTEQYREWQRGDNRKDGLAWEGLYRRLEDELREGSDGDRYNWMGWGHVNNAAGGFHGFWWQPPGMDVECPPYLQLQVTPWGKADAKEREKLCFKVDAEGESSEKKEELKWQWHERICNAGGKHVCKPKVMKKGETMTVAEWKGEWLAFGNAGKLDISKTVMNLRKAEDVLTQAVQAVNAQ